MIERNRPTSALRTRMQIGLTRSSEGGRDYWALTLILSPEYTVELRVRTDAVEETLTPYVWSAGDAHELVTPEELERRIATAREHGDPYDVDAVRVLTGAAFERAVEQLVAHWDALSLLVVPAYTF